MKQKQQLNSVKEKINYNPDDVDTSIFSNLILDDQRHHSESDIRTNRDFNSYDIKALEACSLNSEEKEQYTKVHLRKDLAYYFPYMPTSELDRLVSTTFWLMKEALKNYGNVSVDNFGKFTTYDRPYKLRYNVGNGQKYKVPMMKLRRVLEFTPAPAFKQLITPRELRYMRVSTKNVDTNEFPDLFTSYAREKMHRRQGQLLVQKAFDENFRFMGYSDAYISAIYNGDL